MPGRNIKYSGSTRIVLYAAKTTRLEMQDPASYSIFFKSTPGGRKKRLYIICTSFNLKFEPHCVQVSLRISQKNSFYCGCVSSMKFHVFFFKCNITMLLILPENEYLLHFFASTVDLQQADHTLTVHRQCMQSHRSSWSNTTKLNSARYIFHCL